MATSLHVFVPYNNEPPSTVYALLNTRNSHPTLDYNKDTDWSAVFTSVFNRAYASGGVTVVIIWTSTVTAGNVIWDAAFERNNAAFDIDADSFAAVQSVTDAAPANAGELQYATIAFANGAEMDSLAAGEMFRLKVTRDADNGSDTLAGDTQILAVEIYE